MPILDHLAVVAPTLIDGVAHVAACLGLDIPPGGRHREMGTANHLMGLAPGLFLEVIAVDPDAPPPGRPRWFGLDDAGRVRADWAAGRRLRALVARTDDLDGLLARHPGLFGEPVRVTRGDLAWRFAVPGDGGLPADGRLPCLMDWGPAGSPAGRMPDLGARLERLTLADPDPAGTAALHARVGLVDGPVIVPGPHPSLTAEIRTPAGLRILT